VKLNHKTSHYYTKQHNNNIVLEIQKLTLLLRVPGYPNKNSVTAERAVAVVAVAVMAVVVAMGAVMAERAAGALLTAMVVLAQETMVVLVTVLVAALVAVAEIVATMPMTIQRSALGKEMTAS